MDPTHPDHASRETVLAAQRGDREALDALICRHLPALRAFIRLRSDPTFRARESCADIVQTVCRQVLENLGQFEWRGEDSFRNWLFAHAANKILNRAQYHRAARRSPAREAPEGPAAGDLQDLYASICTPSQEVMALEWMGRFEAAMDRLPEHGREVVLLSRIVGLSHAAIAEQLGKSESAVRTLLCRSLGRLATLMDEAPG